MSNVAYVGMRTHTMALLCMRKKTAMEYDGLLVGGFWCLVIGKFGKKFAKFGRFLQSLEWFCKVFGKFGRFLQSFWKVWNGFWKILWKVLWKILWNGRLECLMMGD